MILAVLVVPLPTPFSAVTFWMRSSVPETMEAEHASAASVLLHPDPPVAAMARWGGQHGRQQQEANEGQLMYRTVQIPRELR